MADLTLTLTHDTAMRPALWRMAARLRKLRRDLRRAIFAFGMDDRLLCDIGRKPVSDRWLGAIQRHGR